MSRKSRDRRNGYSLLHIDVPVVALGERLSLQGWSKDQVAEAIMPNIPTNNACWHCAHTFDWVPVRIPLKRDDRSQIAGNIKDLFYSRGTFCTYNCAKTHALTKQGCKAVSVTYLALLANKNRLLHLGETSKATNAVFIKPVPNKYTLKLFGGSLSIDEYRRGCIRFDGSTCGQADQLFGYLDPKKRRDWIQPPSFIDKSIVTIVRCENINGELKRSNDGTSVFPKMGHQPQRSASSTQNTSSDMSIRQRMAESRKRRETPGQGKGGAKTLDQSMGVVINKKRKSC